MLLNIATILRCRVSYSLICMAFINVLYADEENNMHQNCSLSYLKNIFFMYPKLYMMLPLLAL